MEFELPSFAKINWTLRVLSRREDDYHELFTVFQTVSLHDTISFEKSNKLELTCDDPNIPTDAHNLMMKAAILLSSQFAVGAGVRMHLRKRIPAPGGLGGGSSNAAVALIGLARFWELDPTIDLFSIAEEIGSDVPFFLVGGTAFGTGRGEVIEPVADIEAENMLIVTPSLDVSTADVFGGLNAPALTKRAVENILSVCRKDWRSFDAERSALKNDLEAGVFAAHPEIRRAKETLLELGAANAAMSGSGASVFAVFEKQETRQAAMKALDRESTWRKFAVSAISRSEYREALQL
jgi:4-diphosphocytidyl-2-C-methyl-D-erythritol kinase